MKIFILAIALFAFSLQSFGQKKSKADPQDAKIDSLTLVTKNLKAQSDSLSIELVKYKTVYNVVKEKVIHYNFDPTRSAFLIDSLQTSRDSLNTSLFTSTKSTASKDMLLLTQENAKLKFEIDSLKKNIAAIPDEELIRAAAIGSLKQLKDLLDAKIITDVEFLSMKKKYIDKL